MGLSEVTSANGSSRTDWLEGIVALPEQLFYNTGINTYIWIVTNRKRKRRAVNPRDNFAYVFDPKFEELVMNRMDRSNEQVVKFLEDPQLKSFITSRFRNQVYDRIQAEMKSRINIQV